MYFYFLHIPCELKLPLCGEENVSLRVSVELLDFTSSSGLVSIMLYGGGGVSAGKRGRDELDN